MAAGIDLPRWLSAGAMALAALPLGVLAGLAPPIAVAVAIGLAFVLVTFTDLGLGLSFFVLLSFVGFLPYGMYDVLARIVLILAWFALLMTRKRSELEFPAAHPVGTTILMLFFAWVCVSLVWAESSGEVFEAIERYGLSALLLLIVFTAVRSERDLGRLAVGFVAGAVTAALYGVIAGAPDDGTEGRLGTALLDPNILAASLVSATALAVAVIAIYRSPAVKLSMLSALGFCALAVWLTASRGGLIALAAVLIAAIALAGRWRLQVVAIAAVLAGATYVYFAAVAPDDVRERVTGPIQGQERIVEGRTTLWQVAMRAAEANPVTGVGASNFRVASRHYLLEPGVLARSDQVIDVPVVVHNAYLEMAAELGAVGLILFLSLVLFCLGCAIRAAWLYGSLGDRRMQVAAIGVATAQVGSLAANVFISDQYSTQLWVLLGLGPAVLSLARSAERARGVAEASLAGAAAAPATQPGPAPALRA